MGREQVIDVGESQVETPPSALAARPASNGALTVRQDDALAILYLAVERGATPEAIKDIVAVVNQQQDRAAAREFAAALAAFQADCPTIRKSSTARIVTQGGSNYSYNYAELDEIANTIRPHLHKHGLSYGWDFDETGGRVTCTCIVRHRNGHSITARFACATDTAAKMSGAQKNAASGTYAKRQSLIMALGLITGEPDSDGAPPAPVGTISESQAANLRAMLEETKSNVPIFLNVYHVERIEDLSLADFPKAMRQLERKRDQQGGKA